MILAGIKKIVTLLTPGEKREAVILFLLMIVASVLEIFSLGILPAFIAVVSSPEIIEQHDWLKNTLHSAGIDTQKQLIIYGSVAIIIVFIVKNIFAAFLIQKRIRYTAGIHFRLSSTLLTLYYNAPYTFHLSRNTTDLFSKVSDEVRLMVNNVMLPFITLCMDGLFTIATLILLLIYEPVISITSFFIFSIAGIIYWFAVRKKAVSFGSQLSMIRTQMYKNIYEGFGGLKDARVLNRERYFINHTINSFEKTIKASTHQQIISLFSRPFIETLAILGMLCIVMILVSQGRPMTSVLAVLALFAIAAIRLLPTINQLITGYTGIKSFIFGVDEVHDDFINLQKEEQLLHERHIEPLPYENLIEVKDVRYRYPGSEEFAVNGISLNIKKGEAIALVGSSGAGKTTLVDMLLGLLKPDSGSIIVDGKNVYDDIRAWQQNIGYIPQQIFLADQTIKKNIAFGINDELIDESKLWDAIKAAQLETLINELPQGLETEIGERGVRLSGGQRQRIGIARALYHNPRVLIMDEATSALDNVTERYVVEAIDRLKGDRTIITIAHRLSTVKNCDMIYFIQNARVATQGDYGSLLENSTEFKNFAS